MEFNRLLSLAISNYGEPDFINDTKKKNLNEKSKKIDKKNYFLINRENDIDEWIKQAEESGELAIDTETSSLDAHQADLIGISLSTKIGRACYIPIGHKSGNCLKKTNVLKKLKPILEDKSVKKNRSKYKV